MNSLKKSFEISHLDMSEVEEVSQFHRRYYGDIRPPMVWQWEYSGINPEKSIIVVARDEGDMAATLGVIPLPLNIAGTVYLSGKVESVLIDPNYRGSGLFKDYFEYAIDACRQKEMTCLWGFTSAVGVFQKVNFKVFFNIIKLSVLPVSYGATIENARHQIESKPWVIRWLMKAGIRASVIYAAIRRMNKKRIQPRLLNKYEVVEKLKSPRDIPDMFTAIRKELPDLVHLHMDEEYLDWRIYNNPAKMHLTYFAYQSDRLAAYMIAAISENSGYITDFMFIEKNAGILLLKKTLNHLIRDGKGTIIYSGNRENPLNIKIFSLLRKFGFLEKDSHNDWGFQCMSFPEEEKLADVRNWYVTNLWAEGI